MVDKIRINGAVIYQREDLLTKLQEEIEKTEKQMSEMNRQARRSKTFKLMSSSLAFLGALAIGCTGKAYAADASLQNVSAAEPKMWVWILDNLLGISKITGSPEGVTLDRENSFGFKLAHYMTNTLFHTQDFFSNSSVMHIFNVIFYIVMSFSTLMIGKKGMDMVKARTLGSTSTGASEFIIRLLASVLMSFFSLDIIGLGIQLSNITTGVLMNNIAKGAMSFDSFAHFGESFIGSIFWFMGYTILFVILGVRYWIRQINLVVLGVMTPVANMAWVTDGGAMLGTLIRQLVVSLTTPVVQCLTLGLGTTILFETNQFAGSGFVGLMNSLLIGVSTMFLMIFTPEFLNKFISGSANPLKYATELFTKAKSLPGRVKTMFQ